MSWLASSPHEPSYVPENAAAHLNYCRAPDHNTKVKTPWCYTTDPEIRYDFCSQIPKCDQARVSSFIIKEMYSYVATFCKFSTLRQCSQSLSHLWKRFQNPFVSVAKSETITRKTVSEFQWLKVAEHVNAGILIFRTTQETRDHTLLQIETTTTAPTSTQPPPGATQLTQTSDGRSAMSSKYQLLTLILVWD